MSKAISQAMKFEKTGERKLSAKAGETLVTNINDLKTYRILSHLYRRHEMPILYIAVTLSLAWGFSEALR